MKRLTIALATAALAALCLAPTAQAAFGFKALSVSFEGSEGQAATQAGSHPHAMRTVFELNTVEDGGKVLPDESIRDLEIDLPEGMAVDPTAVPVCSAADFLVFDDDEGELAPSACPDETAVGYTAVRPPGQAEATDRAAVYNLDPPPGSAARLGFHVLGVTVVIDGGLRPGGDRNLYAKLSNLPQAEPFDKSETVLWGDPTDPAHDTLRGNCIYSGEKCPSELEPTAFLTLPRHCEGELATAFRARSWQEPGRWVEQAAPSPQTTGCAKLGFAAQISAEPTTRLAESPSGLEFGLGLPNPGLTAPEGIAHSDIGEIEVALPEGITVNPSVAEGLEACSRRELGRERAGSSPGEGCPEASKVGELEVRTPLLADPLRGSVYVASQGDNPFGSLLAIYLVIRDRERGILVTQAGEVSPDPKTGQLVSTFPDVPQVPFAELEFRFRSGGRSPLITPPACGDYETEAEFTPRANPSSRFPATAPFEISGGPGGGPCPSGSTPPFLPGFEAGALSNQAAAHSPFLLRLTRRDGDQDIVRFDAKLPPGMVAKLAGTAWCPEALIALTKRRDGREERRDPACPAASRIGSALAGAGVGNQLTYVPGSVYLAGPFAGAPLSVLGVVPAVAGPYDVGTVVTRQALRVDPRTAEVTVDGALSDPIPHILAGIPLKVRDIRVAVDRPQFTLNPTSCAPMSVLAGIWGGGRNPFSLADDAPAPLAVPYQAAGCRGLGFSPRLGIRLKGKTRRGGHPALRATYVPKAGEANIRRLALTFPNSEFVENAHFKTICTRVQYAAGPGGGALCPPGSVYGKVKAWTPLLAEPLEGPVYLRSSDNLLPDAVFALRGLIDAEVAVRIDSKKGRLRATVQSAPDVPVSRVVVQMRGGDKGLFVNSRDICRGTNRARAAMVAQSGTREVLRPKLRPAGCGKKGKRKARRASLSAARSAR